MADQDSERGCIIVICAGDMFRINQLTEMLIKPLLWQTNPFSPYLWEFQSSGCYRSLITKYLLYHLCIINLEHGETKKKLICDCWKKCCAEIDDAKLFLSMS